MTNNHASKPHPYSPDELEKLRDALLSRRRAITESQAQRLSEFTDSDSRTHLADIEEVSESSDTDSFCEILGAQDTTLLQIDLALEKIDSGSYGLCEECGQPIPRVRLEALPFASNCVSCQRKQELDAQLATGED